MEVIPIGSETMDRVRVMLVSLTQAELEDWVRAIVRELLDTWALLTKAGGQIPLDFRPGSLLTLHLSFWCHLGPIIRSSIDGRTVGLTASAALALLDLAKRVTSTLAGTKRTAFEALCEDAETFLAAARADAAKLEREAQQLAAQALAERQQRKDQEAAALEAR